MTDEMSLYRFEGCPYCDRVEAAIVDLGLTVEVRDIRQERQHHQELVAAMGRQTVPVLRTDGVDGTQWLPESADIVRHLYEKYGNGQAPTVFATGTPQMIASLLALTLVVCAILSDEPFSWFLLAAAGVVWVGRSFVGRLARSFVKR